MLIAAGRLGGDRGAAGVPAIPLGASVLLHLVILAGLVAGPVRREPAGEQPPIEVELIQQQAQRQGAAPTPPAAVETPAPSPPEGPAGGVRVAPLLPPAPLQPMKPAPEVNLGAGVEDLDPLSVTSKDVVPPAPDSRFRNLPPRYPAEAGRIGAEGVVQLMIHVSAGGLPGEVLVAHSSGYEVLDQEAQRAVRLWRFRPAQHGGQAVPFDYLLNIRFSLGDR